MIGMTGTHETQAKRLSPLRDELDRLAKEIENVHQLWALLAEALEPICRPRSDQVPSDRRTDDAPVAAQEPGELVGAILRQRLHLADLAARLDACIHRLEI